MNITIQLDSYEDIKHLIDLIKNQPTPAPVQNIIEQSEPGKEEPIVQPESKWKTVTEACKIVNLAKNTITYHLYKYNLPYKREPHIMLDIDAFKKHIETHNLHAPNAVKKADTPKTKTKDIMTSAEWRYSEFHSELKKTIREAGFDKELDYNKLMSKTFKYMTNNYGIVWDQVRKECKEKTGRYIASTTLLAYYMELMTPTTKNLTISCLKSIIKEELNGKNM